MTGNYIKSPCIGMQCNVEESQHTRPNGRVVVSYYLNDPAFVKKVKKIHPGCRIILPGTLVTADYRAERFNIRVHEFGIVTSVYKG